MLVSALAGAFWFLVDSVTVDSLTSLPLSAIDGPSELESRFAVPTLLAELYDETEFGTPSPMESAMVVFADFDAAWTEQECVHAVVALPAGNISDHFGQAHLGSVCLPHVADARWSSIAAAGLCRIARSQPLPADSIAMSFAMSESSSQSGAVQDRACSNLTYDHDLFEGLKMYLASDVFKDGQVHDWACRALFRYNGYLTCAVFKDGQNRGQIDFNGYLTCAVFKDGQDQDVECRGQFVYNGYVLGDVYVDGQAQDLAPRGQVADNEYVISDVFKDGQVQDSAHRELLAHNVYMSCDEYMDGWAQNCAHRGQAECNEYMTFDVFKDGQALDHACREQVACNEYVDCEGFKDDAASLSFGDLSPAQLEGDDMPPWARVIVSKLILDATVLFGWATLCLSWLRLVKSGAHLCMVGVAATLLVESKWIIRGRVKHKRAQCLYDPGQFHDGDCLFASLAFCILQRRPSRSEVSRLRGLCAQLWRRAPEQHLAQVASRVGLSSAEYIAQIGDSLWGGMPEVELLCEALRLPITVTHGSRMFRFGGHGTTALCFDRQHYTVLCAPAISRWSRYSFLVRSRKGNLRSHFDNSLLDLDSMDMQHNGQEGRGGAPRAYPFAEQVPAQPQVALIYHGTFAPCHKGHIATVATAFASVELAGAKVVRTVLGFTTEKSARKKFHFPELCPAGVRAEIARAVVADSGFDFIEIDPIECSASEALAARYRSPGVHAVFVLGSDVKGYGSSGHTIIVGRSKGEVKVAPFSLLNFRGACNQVSDYGLCSTDVRRSLLDGVVPNHYGPRASSALSDAALGRMLNEVSGAEPARGSQEAPGRRNLDALPKPMPKKRKSTALRQTVEGPTPTPPQAQAQADVQAAVDAPEADPRDDGSPDGMAVTGARIIVKAPQRDVPPDGFLFRAGTLKFAHPRFTHLATFFRDCVQPVCCILGVDPISISRRGAGQPLRVSFVPSTAPRSKVYASVMDVLAIDEFQRAFAHVAGSVKPCMYVAANFIGLDALVMDPDSYTGLRFRSLLVEAAEYANRSCLIGTVPVSISMFDAHHHAFVVCPFHDHLPILGVAAEVVHLFNSYLDKFRSFTVVSLQVDPAKCDQYVSAVEVVDLEVD
eukprot:4257569-Amphidinium_carterae.1